MNYQEISQKPNFKEELMSTLSYGELSNECLMLKDKKTLSFALVSPEKVSGRIFQGYIECVSNDTLSMILGTNADLSEDGTMEAEKVIEWMNAQN